MDKIAALIAPFSCIQCGRKGHLLCSVCQAVEFESQPSRCYRCHRSTTQFQVCPSCRKSAPLNHVWVCSMYEGISKSLLESLKFQRARSASNDIGDIMADILPLIPRDTVVCPLPTAPSRVRIRGYDQAVLLGRRIAKKRKLRIEKLIVRLSATRQLGADRKARFEQAASAFGLSNKPVKGKTVLLVDDVTTSGATIEAAAKLLKKAGAKSVDAVIFAQALD